MQSSRIVTEKPAPPEFRGSAERMSFRLNFPAKKGTLYGYARTRV